MPDSIVGPLLDLAPDVLVAQPGTVNHAGKWTAAGDSVSPSCRISGKRRRFLGPGGQEMVSSMQAIVLSTSPVLSVDGYRYDLPARYPAPRTSLRSIFVKLVNDENGLHHQVVMFP